MRSYIASLILSAMVFFGLLNKTGGMYYIKRKPRRPVIDIPLSQYEPVDLRGMPSVDRIAFTMSTIR